MAQQTSANDQAINLYKEYVKQLNDDYARLIVSVQDFLKKVRKQAEELEAKKEGKVLSNLEKSLTDLPG